MNGILDIFKEKNSVSVQASTKTSLDAPQMQFTPARIQSRVLYKRQVLLRARQVKPLSKALDVYRGPSFERE